MATIGQLYKAGATEAKPRKVFWVPLAELYVEDGYNIRDVDQAHVEEFRDAYLAGEYVPPMTWAATPWHPPWNRQTSQTCWPKASSVAHAAPPTCSAQLWPQRSIGP